jgi:hypothetical protein
MIKIIENIIKKRKKTLKDKKESSLPFKPKGRGKLFFPLKKENVCKK